MTKKKQTIEEREAEWEAFENEVSPEPPSIQTFCKCGAKTSWSCGDQCRVCYHSAEFLSKPERFHLAVANVPSRAARRALKWGLHLKNNQKAYPGTLIPETLNNSLFLCGKAGVGKTTIAISAMLYHMYQVNTVKEHFKTRQTFWFETIPNMVVNLR